MLHSQRRREAELLSREAAGESFWTEAFPEAARNQILHVMRGSTYGDMISADAQHLILLDEGLLSLTDPSLSAAHDFYAYLKTCDDDMMPTVIEAWIESASLPPNVQRTMAYGVSIVRPFRDAVNEILRRSRIAFELIDTDMVEMDSRALHIEVVKPVLQLLARSDDGWAGAESAYRDALEQISRGSAAKAITDAGTALQEALEAAGAIGNQLRPLITSARKKGLLAPHDEKLGDSVAKALEWVSSDRSQSGDAHHASDAELDDAWLVVHVAGALILRLSKGSARGK